MKESAAEEDGLKPKKRLLGKAASILKKTALLGGAATICVLSLLILLSAAGLYTLLADNQGLEGEAKLMDGQLAAKESQLRSKQGELDAKNALLKQKNQELSSSLAALNLTREKAASLENRLAGLQGENKALTQRLNNTAWERDQMALQAGNYSTEYRVWEQKYDALQAQYGQEQKKRADETALCEDLGVELSPSIPRVSDDFTLRFAYGNGSPASGLPVYVRSKYEVQGGTSEKPRFHLTDKEGKVYTKGEDPSYKGSGETTVIVTCEKTQYIMRFYLYGNAQDIWHQTYALGKIAYDQ
jgi:hypothetical protein